MPIDLGDYAHTSGDRGWGMGWPQCSPSGTDLATVVADRSGSRVAVRKALAVLVDALVDWTERPDGGNYLLKPGECGGFNCRPIKNTNTPSNHSWAVAVDLNWNDNPYAATQRHTIPAYVAAAWNRYGFAWGGDYRGARKDWMHFEFMGTPADAIERTNAALAELPGTPAADGFLLGSEGPAVEALQSRLNRDHPDFSHLVVDGDFGPATEAALREFQRRQGIPDDGVANPRTLAALQLQ